jgi:hypothetical protein
MTDGFSSVRSASKVPKSVSAEIRIRSSSAARAKLQDRSPSVSAETCDPLPTLDSALAVRETVARLISDVYAGRMNPRIASGLAPLMNLQLRAIETTSLEQRLTKVEKLLAKKNLDESKPKAQSNRDDSPLPSRPGPAKGEPAEAYALSDGLTKQ